jgi:hypothetical protein
MNVREKLNASKTVVGIAAGVLIAACLGFIYWYWSAGRIHVDPTQTYYSDDDGHTYYKDSVYKFPPYDHDGKTAVEAVVAESNGHDFIAYLMRFTPEARKQLQQKYDDAVKNNLPVQNAVLTLLGNPGINMAGMQIKLPGSGHDWVPRSRLPALDIKSPDGELPDRYINEP